MTLRRWTLRRQCRENEHDDPYDVGLGTAQVFNTNDDATQQKAEAVLQALSAAGGSFVDTASVYGNAEAVLGEVITTINLRPKLFVATKLEAPDAAELKRSRAG